jgi:hypothetical protein
MQLKEIALVDVDGVADQLTPADQALVRIAKPFHGVS